VTTPLAARSGKRLYVPTLLVVVATGMLGLVGWRSLGGSSAVAHSIGSFRGEVIGPLVLIFLVVVLVAERLWPAVPRPLVSRGAVHDLIYLVLYALAVVPLIALIGAGFFDLMDRVAPWLVLPKIGAVPAPVLVALEIVVLDAANWLAHYGLHRCTALWRLHAVHHSQEELSVLTSFRTHPLVHTAYLVSALPALFFVRNATLPAVAIAIYACLGALPHANVRWTYGRLGKMFVSPAYHRLHHAADGRIDINLGIVLTVWDVASGRSVFPVPGSPVPSTGLAGRPVPVEHARAVARPLRTLWAQWADPFTTRVGSRTPVTTSQGGQWTTGPSSQSRIATP
jgi:sterol desaturase/sphingolipid hydroxylase (fatty acid hydroxylase superfamily)